MDNVVQRKGSNLLTKDPISSAGFESTSFHDQHCQHSSMHGLRVMGDCK